MQEHKDTQKDLEPTKHFKNNPVHSFTGNVLLQASPNKCNRESMKASNIALLRRSLNERIESKKLWLFQNGVT